MAESRGPDIRISSGERDEAVRLLGTHLSTGRLDPAEYEFRHVRAVAARTRTEIEALFTDLPAPHPDMSAAVSPLRALRTSVGPVVGRKAPPAAGLEATPASEALNLLAGLVLLLGLPGTVVLTVFTGLWWTIVVAVLVTIVAGVLAEGLKRRSR
ncbi:DUF1707 SHOCT-like domain-containing protein [Actinokineospora sp. G85]|uniref:DUF1707 SHOCT-like domain-containing protein n=1 Tax=Actinokineospora sp. G85 TaxID=3406626 RepID=UPI003C751B2D